MRCVGVIISVAVAFDLSRTHVLASPAPAPQQGVEDDSSQLNTPPGPASLPRQGNLAGLDPNAATFKEVDYLGAKSERSRYADSLDFVYDFPNQEGMLTTGNGGQSLQVSIDTKPAMYGSDAMSQTLFSLVACGLNIPHYHPRASKILHVLTGEVSVGFVEEGSVETARAIGRNLTAGQSIIIPKGLAMWVHNLQCQEAQYLDTWSNADPGISNIVPSLMKMPLATIAAALSIDTATAAALQARARSPIQQGPPECISRCNATSSTSSQAFNTLALSPIPLSTLPNRPAATGK